MTPTENLHYAIGELAYAVACSDGKVQKEEREKFHNIVAAELRSNDPAFDVSGIIFQIMDKDHTDPMQAYKWAMDQLRLNSHYLSPMLKDTFIRVIEKVANAFPPVTASEQRMIDNFKKEIACLNGDPVYYERVKP